MQQQGVKLMMGVTAAAAAAALASAITLLLLPALMALLC
jgi:hypothetical protein